MVLLFIIPANAAQNTDEFENKVNFELINTQYTISVIKTNIQFQLNLTFIGNELTNSGFINYDIQIDNIKGNVSFQESGIKGVQLHLQNISDSQLIRLDIPSGSISNGVIFSVLITGQLHSTTINSTTEIINKLKLNTTSPLLTIVLLIPQTDTILGMIPAAHQSRYVGTNIKYIWNNLRSSTFKLKLTYNSFIPEGQLQIVSYDADNQITKFQMNILVNNTKSMTMIVQVYFPNWLVLNETENGPYTLAISTYSTQIISFKQKQDLSAGNYTGTIFISYQGEILYQKNVSLFVPQSILPRIMVILSGIILTTLSIYWLREHFVIINKRNTLPNEIHTNQKPERQIQQIDDKKNPAQINELQPEKEMVRKIQEEYINDKQVFDEYVTLSENELKQITHGLNERETKIIRFINENKGKSQQAIADEFEISKATISRILNKLQNKGILYRKKIGMTNKVYINTNR